MIILHFHSSLSFFTFILYYSYQYNMKIVGVPLISESESAQDTAELCVKLFSGLGVDVSISEIDIAHRVPSEILQPVMATEDN